MPVTSTPGTPNVAQVTSSYVPTTPAGVSENATSANFAWTQYPRVDNFGTIDPAGPYWKPDSNIQAPGNFPITNLLPGTVTNVQKTSWGQTVVTVKLDTPLNSLATHTFYEHMSSASVNVGQHIASGQLVGFNNPSGQVPIGFGLYSGDVYGGGSAWNVLQNDLKPGGAGLLNPASLLNNFKAGKGPTGVSIDANSASQSLPQNAPSCAPWDIQCITNSISGAVGSLAVRVGLFALALVLIILGGVILIHPNPVALAKKAAKAAVLA